MSRLPFRLCTARYSTVQHSTAERTKEYPWRLYLRADAGLYMIHPLPRLLPPLSWCILLFYQRCLAIDWMLDRHVFVTHERGRRRGRWEKERKEKGEETF
jgi:hypothetical protein